MVNCRMPQLEKNRRRETKLLVTIVTDADEKFLISFYIVNIMVYRIYFLFAQILFTILGHGRII